MKIVEFLAENVKRLKVAYIKPDGALVQITSKENSAGKTSTLDSLWWALGGLANIQKSPIREGENQARIRLNMGDIVVERKFTRKEGGAFTSSLEVKSADGAKFPSPQTMLDDLLGKLTFDPLAFSRMDSREQYDTLKKFVQGVDFDAIDRDQKADYDRRTEVNRKAKESLSAANAIKVSETGPTEFVDDKDVIGQMASAAEANGKIEGRKARRKAAAEKIVANRDQSRRMLEDAKDSAAGVVKDANDVLKRAQEALEAAGKRSSEVLAEAQERAGILETEAADLEQQLKDAPALPTPVDVEDLRKKLDGSRQANEEVRLRKQKVGHLQAAKDLEEISLGISDSMDKRATEKAHQIAAANLPVKGLGFGEGIVLMNGIPFEQASDAERLRVSIAIAMALNPKLKVIRVRDGSLLSEASLKMVEQMAKDQDYQVWVERLESSGKVGFVIEDGMVVGQQIPDETKKDPVAAKPKSAAKSEKERF